MKGICYRVVGRAENRQAAASLMVKEGDGGGCPDGQHVGVETMKNVWWELGPWREPLKAPPQAQWGALLPSSNPPVSSSDTYWPNLNGSWWARELGKCNMQRLALQRAEQGKDGEWIRDPRGEWPLQTLNLRNTSLFIRAAVRYVTSPTDELLFSMGSGGHFEDSLESTQAMRTLIPNLSTQSNGLLFGEVFQIQEYWTSEPQNNWGVRKGWAGSPQKEWSSG